MIKYRRHTKSFMGKSCNTLKNNIEDYLHIDNSKIR